MHITINGQRLPYEALQSSEPVVVGEVVYIPSGINTKPIHITLKQDLRLNVPVTADMTNMQACFQLVNLSTHEPVTVTPEPNPWAPNGIAYNLPFDIARTGLIKCYNFDMHTLEVFSYRWLETDGSVNVPVAPEGYIWSFQGLKGWGYVNEA